MTARAGRVGLLVVSAAAAALSCGEPSTLGPKAYTPRADLFSRELQPFLQCTPLPTATVTQVVDATGGVLQVGPHTLSIPPGALTGPVTITAVAPPGTVNRVQFEPQGLTFGQPASLTMSYANCGVLGWVLPQIAYTTDALEILQYLASAADPLAQTVTAPIQHFSNYAVAW